MSAFCERAYGDRSIPRQSRVGGERKRSNDSIRVLRSWPNVLVSSRNIELTLCRKDDVLRAKNGGASVCLYGKDIEFDEVLRSQCRAWPGGGSGSQQAEDDESARSLRLGRLILIAMEIKGKGGTSYSI